MVSPSYASILLYHIFCNNSTISINIIIVVLMMIVLVIILELDYLSIQLHAFVLSVRVGACIVMTFNSNRLITDSAI